MLTLEKGRPVNESGRLKIEIQAYDLLDSLNIPFYRIDHAPAYTMEDCAEVDKLLNAAICKNLFLTNRPRTDYYLLMISAEKSFKTGPLSRQIGSSRLEFGEAQKMEEFMNTTPGSASILGLMHDKDKKVKLLVDEDILKGEYFGCHPCINTSSIRLKTKDAFGPLLKALDHEMTLVTI